MEWTEKKRGNHWDRRARARWNGAKGERKDELEWSGTFVQGRGRFFGGAPCQTSTSEESSCVRLPPSLRLGCLPFPLLIISYFPQRGGASPPSSSSLFVSEIRGEISSLRSNPAKAIGGLGAIVGALEGGGVVSGTSKFDGELFSCWQRMFFAPFRRVRCLVEATF